MNIDDLLHYKLSRLAQYVDMKHLQALKVSFTNRKIDESTHFILNNEIETFIHFLFIDIEQKIEEKSQQHLPYPTKGIVHKKDNKPAS